MKLQQLFLARFKERAAALQGQNGEFTSLVRQGMLALQAIESLEADPEVAALPFPPERLEQQRDEAMLRYMQQQEAAPETKLKELERTVAGLYKFKATGALADFESGVNKLVNDAFGKKRSGAERNQSG